ncbi:sugar kinase [Paenibacillus bovis]|uniref:2-dehydro-3-deoxygluconokinase n=1 Tax=Paenibacillus bovis TaxID=1616788 RepID=A0A172ZLI4_9BACL|nr:sugar kinase [Paenibacillus bovis]ANF98000.1 2-dehydro-3-deoxygluconokinase [Paenibacillus bovis]
MNNQNGYPEVVTFGESMGLLTAEDSRGLEYASQLRKSFGGAESNLAIGIARLGHSAGWCGRLGDDPLGHMIQKSIRGEGVDVSRSILATGEPTGLMLRENASGHASVYYYRKLSAASRMTPEDLDEDYIRNTRILHVTGITAAISESGLATVNRAMDIAREAGVTVCFDPNLRLKLWTLEEARRILLALAEKCDYFLPGLDELALLYETEDQNEIFARLRRLRAVSIVKGGPDLTYVVEKENTLEVPYFKAERVLDTVGAGDGFCAGFITGLLRGYTIEEAVRLGNLNGSMVIQAVGDWEALPTDAQVQAKLNNKAHVER